MCTAMAQSLDAISTIGQCLGRQLLSHYKQVFFSKTRLFAKKKTLDYQKIVIFYSRKRC